MALVVQEMEWNEVLNNCRGLRQENKQVVMRRLHTRF